MTVWRDLKSRACSKAARLRKERVQTGNRAVTTAPLTEVERRIVSLIGVEYTFGTECPDSMPEEEMIQHDMEIGVSTSEVISLPQSQYSELEFLEIENLVPVDDTVAQSGSRINVVVMSPPPLPPLSPPPPPEPQVTPIVQRDRSTRKNSELEFLEIENLVPVDDTVAQSGSRINVVVMSPPPLPPLSPPPPPEPRVTPIVQRDRSTRKNLNPRRSVDEQYRSARHDFLAVADSNAESMRMLAAAAKLLGEAAKTQAEASIKFANAAEKIAEAVKTQAETSLNIAKPTYKIAEALINMIG